MGAKRTSTSLEGSAKGSAKGDGESGGEKKTVAEVTVNGEVDIKHPLQNSWTLWFFKNDREKLWEENQRQVISFQTVEDFWALYNHIEVVSKVNLGCDYSLFKTGIKPMWEDERNKGGGRWLINLDKRQRPLHLDNFWLEVMLCLIGEAFGDNGRHVNGSVVSVRPRGDKIAVWVNNSTKEDAIMAIGKMIKQRLGLDRNMQLNFECHEDSKNKSSSGVRSKFTI